MKIKESKELLSLNIQKIRLFQSKDNVYFTS